MTDKKRILGAMLLECFGGPLDGDEIVVFNEADWRFPCVGGSYQRAYVTLPRINNESVEMWFWRRHQDA